jgi:hypothetical protein
MQRALPPGTIDVPVLSPDGFGSEMVVPLKLEWKSLDNQSSLEK